MSTLVLLCCCHPFFCRLVPPAHSTCTPITRTVFVPAGHEKLGDGNARRRTRHRVCHISGRILLVSTPQVAHESTTAVEGSVSRLSTTSLAPSTTTLKFRASICRSVMLINAAELNLRFDDAVVGTRCTKTFTVRNLSEMPLAYTLRLASAKETYVAPAPTRATAHPADTTTRDPFVTE